MADFSERDLLILSNYAYFNCSIKDGTIGENIASLKNEDGTFNEEKVYQTGAVCANMTKEEAVELLTKLDNDEKLKNLHMARNINNDDMRAICYADKDEKEATVVFRGTGGTYSAWEDNVKGALGDTRIQKMAADFVKYECGIYSNLSVTGHSKGGNLAQYVTIACGDQIAKCISYDGQGFSDNFIKENEKEIKASKNKITSISAYNDYVNILLTSIAGTTLFVNNKGINIDGHSSYTMLDALKFDANGEIKMESLAFQGPVSAALEKMLDSAVDIISLLPNGGKELMVDRLALEVGGFFSGKKMDEERQNSNAALSKYFESCLGFIKKEVQLVNIKYDYLSVNTERLLTRAEQFEALGREMNRLVKKVYDIRENLDYEYGGKEAVRRALKKTAEKMDGERIKLSKINNVLQEVVSYYKKCENEAVNLQN